MKRSGAFRLMVMMALIVLLAASYTLVAAQTGNGYDLTWSTVEGGGGVSTGGAFEVSGTIGQADAGALSGGGFSLSSGFWLPAMGYQLYLPLVTRN